MPDILIRVPDSIRCCGLCPCFYAEHPMHCQADAHKPKRTHGAPYSGKPDWCPAKELPPHGDLIEAEHLAETLDYYIREAGWGNEINKALGWVRDDFIKGEAVIVPASEEANHD